MFSVHRKQTPFVVVGSLKIYEKLPDLGFGKGDGSVETSLLCFCMKWWHARIQEFLPGGGGPGPTARKQL